MTNRVIVTETQFHGCLLVASPSWNSDLHSRSVCLLVQHGSEGSVGIFLNRSLQDVGPDLWKHLAGDKPVSQSCRSVHFGGPQSGPVLAIHNRADLAEYTTADGVYLAAQLDHLQQLVQIADNSEVRIIIGQSAWQPGELDEELRAGKWIPMPISPQLVFASEDEMWGRAIRQIGNQYIAAITGAHYHPASSILN
jgi:putative transcriptional regulator